MDGDSIVALCVFAVLIYGFYSGWSQLTTGSGFICGHLPAKAIDWINKENVGSAIIKIIVSLVLAYVFAAITLIKLIIGFLMFMNRMFT